MSVLCHLQVVCMLLLQLQQSVFSTAFNSDEWDHFVFAQQWPMTSCIEVNMSHEHVCYIPRNVSTWTVHGLWPSKGSGMGPEFCNTESHKLDFDPALLDPILAQLVKYWTNIYQDTELYNFWKHEWCKHGTCAVTLESVDSELKYFKKGLQLQNQFDLLRILKDAGINPSDETTYEYTEFLNALEKGLGGFQPKISCAYDKSTKTQYIAQVEFCTDKTFNVIECPAKRQGSLYFVPESVNLRPPSVLEHAAAKSKRRQKGGPESCEQHSDRVNRPKLRSESPCQDTEALAYPVIKYSRQMLGV